MPILDVEEAKHIIFLNFDDKPGYAGVDNPLYSADPDKAVLLAGDAKESLNKLLAGIQQSDEEATSAPSQIEPAEWLKKPKSDHRARLRYGALTGSKPGQTNR